MSGGWISRSFQGSAAEFHARPMLDVIEPELWWFDVDAPALVLGSAQPEVDVDVEGCAHAGVEVVRRRSGGGAVLLLPGECSWVDVLLPRSSPLWTDDVAQSAWWLGEAWSHVVGGTVHRGPLVRNEWSSKVCFAGVGGGEVLAASGGKLVGISQRRTRAGARFQCVVHHRWRPQRYVDLLSPPRPTAVDLAAAAAIVSMPRPDVRAALQAALPDAS